MYTLEFKIIFRTSDNPSVIDTSNFTNLFDQYLKYGSDFNYNFICNYTCREALVYAYSLIAGFIRSNSINCRSYSYTISLTKNSKDMVKVKSLKYLLTNLSYWLSQIKSICQDHKLAITFYDTISPHVLSSILLILDDHYDLIDRPSETIIEDIIKGILNSDNERWSLIETEKILTAYYISKLNSNYNERYFGEHQSVSTGPGDYSLRDLIYQLDDFDKFVRKYSEPIKKIVAADDDYDGGYDDEETINPGFKFILKRSLDGSINKFYESEDSRRGW